ncbi:MULTISPECIES: hypothetical protein [unclassified Streptomyces]|uniref:hypothetical protein n=1 Tax=unclassified Streptomyces TaxID=2593676 RepID=UPI000A796755|nr:hypothetical protein [Streptomyces sp. CB01883]
MINLAHVILYSQDATSTPGSGNCVRGASRSRPVGEQRWGRLTAVRLPGGAEPPLCAPHHPMADSP